MLFYSLIIKIICGLYYKSFLFNFIYLFGCARSFCCLGFFSSCGQGLLPLVLVCGLLLLQSTGSGALGSPVAATSGPSKGAPGPKSEGSAVVAHGLGWPTACGVLVP